jgi:hypothetical protein
MSSWSPTRFAASDLEEDGADVDAALGRGAFGVAQQAGVDAGVPEGPPLAVYLDRAVLQGRTRSSAASWSANSSQVLPALEGRRRAPRGADPSKPAQFGESVVGF